MYADNAGAVIGDLLYQPPPCGCPYGLASLMQNRLSPWTECMQSHVWNMACPGDNVTWGVTCSGRITQTFKPKKRAHPIGWALFFVLKPGSDLLSHGNSHTIIGAELFHFCVRDGNRWCQLAMAARHNLVLTL